LRCKTESCTSICHLCLIHQLDGKTVIIHCSCLVLHEPFEPSSSSIIGAGRPDVDFDLVRNGVSLWEKQLHVVAWAYTMSRRTSVRPRPIERRHSVHAFIFNQLSVSQQGTKVLSRYRDWRVNHVDVSALIFKRAHQIQCCGQRMRLVGQCELL
jgi:hypothetical protein